MMSLLIFKFCLPVLLGYSLFVGLSGRFIPFSKPAELSHRPSWFLGLWTGLAVTILTGVAMHMAFEIPLADVKPMVKPTGLILAGALIPGLMGYYLYRADIIAEMRYQTALTQSAESLILAPDVSMEQSTSQQDIDTLFADVDLQNDMDSDNTGYTHEIDDLALADEVVARNDLVIEGEVIDDDTDASNNSSLEFRAINEPVNAGDNGSVSLLFNQVSIPTLDEPQNLESTAKLIETVTLTQNAEAEAEAEALAIAEAQAEAAAEAETASLEAAEKEAKAQAEIERAAQAVRDEADAEADAVAVQTQLALKASQTEIKQISNDLSEQMTANTELTAVVETLKQSLESEVQLRSQTESHLRITRKALKNLEGDTRDFETDKTEALMVVEEQLNEHVKQTAAAQARANREETLRIAAETTIVEIKKDLLQAKRELRRNTEARAKALSTANKSVVFARQSVQARTRAEARIKRLESRLKLSQETVSSLIAALDKEKARTQNDVTEMAKELILQQKRLDEKRTLDEASRRAQKRLTRRIAKKVS